MIHNIKAYSLDILSFIYMYLYCRYRNFRTFTSPRPSQFSCLAIDHSGDIVCAGALDSFEIFVWSMQTGRLLEVGVVSLNFTNRL